MIRLMVIIFLMCVCLVGGGDSVEEAELSKLTRSLHTMMTVKANQNTDRDSMIFSSPWCYPRVHPQTHDNIG